MIRVAPPLVITSDQVDWALDRFGATLRQDFSNGAREAPVYSPISLGPEAIRKTH